jgi:hypothetical protein
MSDSRPSKAYDAQLSAAKHRTSATFEAPSSAVPSQYPRYFGPVPSAHVSTSWMRYTVPAASPEVSTSKPPATGGPLAGAFQPFGVPIHFRAR